MSTAEDLEEVCHVVSNEKFRLAWKIVGFPGGT